MKKVLKLLSIALLINSATMAQQTTEKRGTKIVFPPNAKAKLNLLGDVELISDLMNTTVTVVGNSEDGLVLKTDNGEIIVLLKSSSKYDPPPYLIRPKPIPRWTPVLPRPKENIVYKLIGIAENGNAVWASPNGKGSCILDATSGKRNDYVGHVTLLR